MLILGIETSCDETAASLIEVDDKKIKIINNLVLSQIDIHKKYGGIVPEVAARKHVEAIIPVIAGSIGNTKPDLISVTQGPGLITSLQVGLQTAKTLSYARHIPLIGINHLEAHLWSFKLTNYVKIKLPALGLIVSGGHTELLLIKKNSKYELIGRTRDDAVGEAFDKVAKLLNLGYPGGPKISKQALKGKPDKIELPKPMIDSPDLDFSFSGLKTAVKYLIKEQPKTNINDLCASFEKAITDVLITKTLKAAIKYKTKSIIIGGGVSANNRLREEFKTKTSKSKYDFYYPALEHTGDNAAMVAYTGYLNKKTASLKMYTKLTALPNMKLV